jgi:hypothetical protein
MATTTASRAVRWLPTVVGLALCVALAAWGVALSRRPPAQAGLTETRTVAVREAAAVAGEAAPVRLRGTLVAMPALRAPDGQEYALQLLEIGDPDGAPDAADGPYRHVLPSQVFLSDGDSVVAVEPADVDASFLPVIVAGTTLRDGRLPPEVAMHVAPGFADLPRREGTRVALRGIRAGAPAAAYGTLVLREGVPSLVRPANGDPFVLTTMTFPELERDLRSRARLDRLGGWTLVALAALGAVLVLVLLRPRS